jgi:hypothetical protein
MFILFVYRGAELAKTKRVDWVGFDNIFLDSCDLADRQKDALLNKAG